MNKFFKEIDKQIDIYEKWIEEKNNKSKSKFAKFLFRRLFQKKLKVKLPNICLKNYSKKIKKCWK